MNSLLDDNSIFGNLYNLVVNHSNPFAPYQNTTEYIDEVLDGTWHQESLERLRRSETDPFIDGLDFKLDVILYTDKTGTSMNQRYPLEPILFTFAVIRRKLRNMPRCWRPAGYIPDLETKSSAEKRYINSRNRGATAQSYHLCLEHILEGFRQVQEEGIVRWLQLGPYKKLVRIRPEMCFVIQDGKSADMMTLRVPSTHPKRRISRCCDQLQAYSDDVVSACTSVTLTPELRQKFMTVGMSQTEVQNDPQWQVCGEGGEPRRPTAKEALGIVEAAKLKLDEQSFVPARNAFVARCIRFGLDPRGIWGANPVDLMHAFQSGIVKYLVKMIIDGLPTSKQVALDRLVHKLFHNLRCKEKSDYPRLTFSKGYSKLSMITSDEWVGKLFVLLLVLKTDEGTAILGNAFEKEDIKVPQSYAMSKMSPGFAEAFKSLWCQARDLNKEANKVDKTRAGATEDTEVPVPRMMEEDEAQLRKRKKTRAPRTRSQRACFESARSTISLSLLKLCSVSMPGTSSGW